MNKFISALFVCLLSCTNNQPPESTDPIKYKYLFDRDVYIDETFPDYYFPMLISAMEEWNVKTKHTAQFNYRGKIPHLTYKDTSSFKNFYDKRLFIIAGGDKYPALVYYKKIYNEPAIPLGVGYYNVIILNIDGVQSFNQIKSVALHELGHTLFLGHSMEPQSIMFPSCNRYCSLYEPVITKQDINNFCKYSYCDR